MSEREIEELEASLRDCESEIDELNSEISRLENDLVFAEGEADDWQREYEDESNAVYRLENELVELRSNPAGLDVSTLDKQLMLELLQKHWDDLTFDQLQKLLDYKQYEVDHRMGSRIFHKDNYYNK